MDLQLMFLVAQNVYINSYLATLKMDYQPHITILYIFKQKNVKKTLTILHPTTTKTATK